MKVIVRKKHLRPISEPSASKNVDQLDHHQEVSTAINNRPLHKALKQTSDSVSKQQHHDHRNDSNIADTVSSRTPVNAIEQPPRPGFNGTWRSQCDMLERKLVIKQIGRIINQRETNTTEITKRQLLMMVKKMEEALYKSAPSLVAYADLTTLDQRLEELARKVQARVAQQQVE